MNKRPSGIKVLANTVGTGAEAVKDSFVSVHLVCRLRRGEVIGNTYEEGRPERFRIGSRDVIAGLEYGVTGMRVGGKRTFRVSPHLGYREAGTADIPPNAILEFEVELLEVSYEELPPR